MKINEKEIIDSFGAAAVWEGNSKTAATMTAIGKLLGALGNRPNHVGEYPFKQHRTQITWTSQFEACNI
jgi:hypothetical protein